VIQRWWSGSCRFFPTFEQSAAGRSLSELAALDWSQLDREFQSYSDFLRTFLADLTRRTQPAAANYDSRRLEVLRQPEFSELHQVQTIIHLLEEEQDQLWPNL